MTIEIIDPAKNASKTKYDSLFKIQNNFSYDSDMRTGNKNLLSCANVLDNSFATLHQLEAFAAAQNADETRPKASRLINISQFANKRLKEQMAQIIDVQASLMEAGTGYSIKVQEAKLPRNAALETRRSTIRTELQRMERQARNNFLADCLLAKDEAVIDALSTGPRNPTVAMSHHFDQADALFAENILGSTDKALCDDMNAAYGALELAATSLSTTIHQDFIQPATLEAQAQSEAQNSYEAFGQDALPHQIQTEMSFDQDAPTSGE